MPSLPDSLFTFLTAACALTVVAVASSALRNWVKTKSYAYIPGPNTSSAIGYILDLHSPDALDWHLNIPQQFGHVSRLSGGFFGADALYITDPAALHSILIRQQAWFPESSEFAGLFGVIHCGDGVASVEGREHRKQRKHMDALFTPGRVSELTPIFYKVARHLQSKLASALSEKPPGQAVNMHDYLTRTTLEIIGMAGVGHTFNSFDDKSSAFDEFHDAITSVLPLASQLFLIMPFLDSWRKMRPVWLRRALASIATFPWPAARKFKAAIDTMHPVYVTLYNSRKKALEEGGSAALTETASGGKDLISAMIQANWDADEEDKMSDAVILANMGSIVHGGQETLSTFLARFLSLVAADTELQQNIRAELQAAKAQKDPCEDLDCGELEKLPLLDSVVREMLRIHAPVPFVWRQTKKDVIVPLTYPIRSTITGEETKELLIKEGTAVYLGISAANRSTTIWGPDAAEFKPERWLNGNRSESKLPGAYSGMMTFLSGAKVCPGRAFAILEIKLVLSVLLTAFSFEPVPEPIIWKMGITLEPRIRGEAIQAPLRVTVL